MTISCLNCNAVTNLDINFDVVNFVCPSCQTSYLADEGGLRYSGKFKETNSHELTLSVGQKSILKQREFVVTGIIIKKAYGSFEWAEYVLQDKSNNFLYLSEADGHWIILEEVEFDKKVANHPNLVDYDSKSFNLYEYYTPEVIGAKGFFDFKVDNKTEVIEYINPPYILSFEKVVKEQTCFYGKHISNSEIKKAFGISNLPSKTGIGLVQPFPFNIANTLIAFCSIAILILISHWFLNNGRIEKEVLNTDIPYDTYNNKEYTSPSFELNGSSAPLVISVYSNVDNSWANVEVTLINEKTNEEIYANKDIEYYHGYTDGENWTEGSTSEEFNICGVSEGKYHLILTPMKQPEDNSNNFLQVKATWNKPSMRNVYMTFLFMGIFLGIIYFLNKNFETRRWQDSDYSPYNQE